jgi:hypothetical protein
MVEIENMLGVLMKGAKFLEVGLIAERLKF